MHVARGETILVVEDEPEVRRIAIAFLEDLGYRVLQAPDAAAAMALVRVSPPIDLILTDVVLPGGTSGRDLAATVREHHPGTCVVLMSGYAREGAHNAELGEAGAKFLDKPFTKAKHRRCRAGGPGLQCRAFGPQNGLAAGPDLLRRRIVVEKNSPRRTLQVLELAALERPEECCEPENSQKQRDWNQIKNDVHQGAFRARRSALMVTSRDELDIASAARSGVINPSIANGTAAAL